MKHFYIFLLLIPVLGFSQSNYQKGYLITNLDDTLRGFIDHKEWGKNPISFNFRKESNGTTQVFSRDNCAAFVVDGAELFKRFVVDISLSEVEIDRLSTGADLSQKRDTVFLKLLRTGKSVSLFSYKDNIKERFYLLRKGELEPYELIQRIYLDHKDTKKVATANRYVGQLLLAMNEFNIRGAHVESKLQQLDYDGKSLGSVVDIINEQEPVRQIKESNVRFFVGAGMGINNNRYEEMLAWGIYSSKTYRSYVPSMTAGFDLFFNPRIGKTLFRAELSLQSGHNDILIEYKNADPVTSINYSFNQLIVSVIPQFVFNVYNADQLKCFLGVGAGLTFVANSKGKAKIEDSGEVVNLDNPVKLSMANFSFQGAFGVVVNKKIEISVGYSPSLPVNNNGPFGIYLERYKLGVNYLFGKN